MLRPAVPRLIPGLILGALSLLSAFLLFQVQPIIGRFILPWFGGSPGVWTTCMLFFQFLLFAGYAYAHGLTLLPRRWQGILHGVLLGAAIAVLPIAPSEAWKPTGAEDPAGRILLLLITSVGLPYFVLSSTGPLVQVWFTRTVGGSNPWRLYALSNVGSLAALLSYPLFFEVRWDVREQTTLWAVAFGAFVILSLSGVWLDRRHAAAVESKPVEVPGGSDHPGWWRRVCWILLPALASSILLAATNHVCQDVAVVPFLWVLPLSLYLLTFIICFEHERWYVRVPVWWALCTLPVVLVACTMRYLPGKPFWMNFESLVHGAEPWIRTLTGQEVDLSRINLAPNILWELGWSIGAMFLACMLCHGELIRLKPAPRRLTEFYLCLSAGGALGGLFVSLGAPHFFSTLAEWPMTLMAAFGLAGFVLLRAIWQMQERPGWRLMIVLLPSSLILFWGLTALGVNAPDMFQTIIQRNRVAPVLLVWLAIDVAAACLVVPLIRTVRRYWFRPAIVSVLVLVLQMACALLMMAYLGFDPKERLEHARNFYGVVSVAQDADSSRRFMTNNGVVHGMQHMGPTLSKEPTTYFGHQTGIGKALDSLKDRANARVGVIGVGAGTVCCYARKGDTYRLYDINPDVVRLAKKYFTYIDDAEKRGARVEVVISDARLALEREPSQQFDVLLLDAFSGDSVPVHLLTREAFAIYQRHLNPDGIIAVQVTNSYMLLAPVIEKNAAEMGFKTTRILTKGKGAFYRTTDQVLVTRNEAFLDQTPTNVTSGAKVELKHDVRAWTDRYHNLFQILIIPSNT